MKRQGWLVVGASLLLVGCGTAPVQEDESTEKTKEPFFVETATVGELRQTSQLNKNGILIGENTVTVTAQIGGRISDINGSAGETVSAGSRILTMADSAGSVSFGVERASAALEQARITYDSTLLNLDQQIDETRRAVRQSQLQQENAQIQAENAELDGTSAARLQLQQLEQQRNTAQFDLETKIQADEQTLTNFENNAENILRDARLLYQEVLDETDKILGISDVNKRENDLFESNLGARNTALKYRAENELRLLLNQEDVLDDFVLQSSTLGEDLRYIQQSLQELSPFLQLVEDMLAFTTTGRGLSETQLTAFNQMIDGLQSQVQAQVSGITQQVNSIESFLRTYKDQQQSIRESIDSLDTQIASTRQNLQTAERSSDVGVNVASLSLESAEARLADLIETRNVTERSLSNAIKQAEIALREAQTNAGKFTVEAPINGSVSEVLVDVGQEVSPGTPLFTITSTENLEVEIGLTSNEVDLVEEGQEVTIVDGDRELKGRIGTITRTANQSLTYKATIIPNETVDLLGGVVRVQIPLESDQLLLPLKNIQIVTTEIGRVTTYQNQTIETITVDLGPIQGSNIIIDEPLDDELEIITSSVRTFDPNLFEVERKRN